MRVSTMTVYRLIKSGELPAIRVGKHLRIRGNDVGVVPRRARRAAPDRRRARKADRGPPPDRSRHRDERGPRRRARADGDLPRVTSFGQVALPPDAMRDGEVVDVAAVTAAIQRLWKELSLQKGEVRVGVASPRVLVRTRRPPGHVRGGPRRRAALPGPGAHPDPARRSGPRLPGPRGPARSAEPGGRRHRRPRRCSGCCSPPRTATWSPTSSARCGPPGSRSPPSTSSRSR